MNEAGRLKVVLDISIALSAEKDRNKLLNMIISKSMEITNCDAVRFIFWTAKTSASGS